jgi:hypothetical protein
MEIETPDYSIPQVSMMLNANLKAMCGSMALSNQVSKYLLVLSLANKSKDKIKSIC